MAFWGKENVIEYKAVNDKLAPMHLYKYGLTELGIMATHLLSKPRKDRKERQPLSQKEAKARVKRLTAQGAQHTCCNTILTTTDPVGLRKSCHFEAVDTYDHLRGALYRQTVRKDELVGHLATYLVVINALPVHPLNAPLLLLSTGKKQTAFCNWLLETHEGLTLNQCQHYITYLVTYELIENSEVQDKMSKKIKFNMDIMVDFINSQPGGRERAIRQLYQGEPPIKLAQDVLQADSPLGAAQAMLQVDSPLGIAQAALQADSSEEAAFKMIQNQGQFNRFLELYLQYNKVKNGNVATDETAAE